MRTTRKTTQKDRYCPDEDEITAYYETWLEYEKETDRGSKKWVVVAMPYLVKCHTNE